MLAGPIKTARLTLRALDPSEVGETYVGWLADGRINQYLETRHKPQTLEDIRAFVAGCNASDDSILFGMFPDAVGRHIGNIKLGPIDAHYQRSEIGLLIGDAEQWGKGFAAEAIGGVANFALGQLGLHKVTAGCYAVNEGSRRAFLANGFREVGRRADHWLVNGAWMDDVMLEKVGQV